ncbi:MAG: Mrp/NBP35 family ATP-binding protein [Clostridiales bacterium]|nr:Mrp/NBP35 family ATP-binding protein [Clostridiales bacterium]
MQKTDVLQVLAGLRLASGKSLLASGRVQDVLLEHHGEQVHVAVVVGEGLEASEEDQVKEAVGRLPGVATVKVVVRPIATTGRPMAKPRLLSGEGGGGVLQRGFRPQPPPPRVPPGTAMLAVASGKGGVGKSTVAVNLAVALSRLGVRTAILDADVYGFGVPMLIGLEEGPRLKDGKIVPPRAHGVEVMSMDFFVRDNQAVIWRGPMLGKTLRQFVEDVLWDDPEVMILDLPPGTGDVALDVVQFFPQAAQLLVTTPDPYAARVAERAGRMALEQGVAVKGVVENMAYLRCGETGEIIYPFGRGGGDAAAHALGVEVLARIPWEVKDGRLMGNVVDPKSEAGRLYRRLAEGLFLRETRGRRKPL